MGVTVVPLSPAVNVIESSVHWAHGFVVVVVVVVEARDLAELVRDRLALVEEGVGERGGLRIRGTRSGP